MADAAENASKRSRSDSEDEDLEGFIVKDSLQKELTRKKKKVDDAPEAAEAESENEESEAESVASELPEDGPELAKVLEKEASNLTKDLKSTEVNGRSLRDRSTIQKPKDTYWDKYGAKDYEKLMEKDHKKDIIDDIKSIKKDQERHKDEQPELPEEFKWPVVSMKDSLETVEAAQNYVCDALGIEIDEDDEDEEESEDDSEDSDETSGSDEDSDSEDDEDSESEEEDE